MKEPITFQWYREADFKKKFSKLTEAELANLRYVVVVDGQDPILSVLPEGHDARDACEHYLGVFHYAEPPLIISFQPFTGLRISNSHQFDVRIESDVAYHHTRHD